MDRSLEERVRKQGWIARWSRGFPVVVFLLSLGTVAASAIAAENQARLAERQRLSTQMAELKQAIMRQESTYGAVLQVSTLYLSRVSVTRAEFDEFARSAALVVDHQAARGIGWAKVTVDPPSQRIAAVVVEYLSPFSTQNRRALGFDMYGEMQRHAAIDRAAASSQPTATGPVILRQDAPAHSPGFLVYKPVPNGGATPKGFVYVAFQGEAFLRSQLRNMPHPPDYAAIYDSRVAPQNLLGKIGDPATSHYLATERMRFAHRDWTIKIGRTAPALLAPSTVWTIVIGLVVATLLLFISHMIVRSAMRDRTAYEWQFRQLQIRQTLNRELNHRVKNTLANVLSIVALTRRTASDLDAFVRGLTGRIRALSATHGLLTQTEWSNASIQDIVEAELAPFLHSDDPPVTVCGDDVDVPPNTALSLGLAIHELATNAAKYGALSTAEGKITVSWVRQGGDRVQLDWIESGGPTIAQPQGRGFGLDLLEQVVSAELGNPVSVRFEPAGLQCTMVLTAKPLQPRKTAQ